jgi:hypothetical protein
VGIFGLEEVFMVLGNGLVYGQKLRSCRFYVKIQGACDLKMNLS